MHLNDMSTNTYVTRAGYAKSSIIKTPLVIQKTEAGELFYVSVDDRPDIPISSDAKAFTFTDFYYCDKLGVPMQDRSTTSAEFLESAAFYVVRDDGSSKLAANMQAVEQYLEGEFAKNPRSKFKIFELIATVAPKPFSLGECIQFVSDETATPA